MEYLASLLSLHYDDYIVSVPGLQASRIERTFPTPSGKRRSTKINSRFRIWPLNSQRICKFACLLQFLHLEEGRIANRPDSWTFYCHSSENLPRASFLLKSGRTATLCQFSSVRVSSRPPRRSYWR